MSHHPIAVENSVFSSSVAYFHLATGRVLRAASFASRVVSRFVCAFAPSIIFRTLDISKMGERRCGGFLGVSTRQRLSPVSPDTLSLQVKVRFPMSIFSANLPMIKCPHNATKSGIRRLFSLSRRRLSIAAFQRLCNECFTDKSTNRSTTFIQNTIGEMVDPAPFLFRSKKEYDCPLINRSLAKIASATSVPNA